MSDPPKQTKTDRLLNLMDFTGAMLLLTAIPTGLMVAFSFHHDYGNWYWAIVIGALLTVSMVLVGGVLLGVGEFFIKRRYRNKNR